MALRQSPDTIVAHASGVGAAAVAVIRVSGPQASVILEALCGGLPEPRVATLRAVGPPHWTPIDRGLVLWFPAPASFTGEDMAELQVHGSRAVVSEVIEAALSLEGVRLAEPGEFVRRAFANAKIDLRQVEGLADLVNAETKLQREQALAQAEGIPSARYEAWRQSLLKAQGLVEAELDFADEAAVGAGIAEQATAIVAALIAELDATLQGRGERLRAGVRIVIAGLPNAGKSSLMNALARRDVAIVSHEAGTTRDVIEVHLDLGGLPVTLVDTAGLRDAASSIEAEGIARALSRAEDADLLLWIVDAVSPVWKPPTSLAEKPRIVVLNKIDLAPDGKSEGDVIVSAKTGQGLEQLLARLEQEASSATDEGAGGALMTRARHRVELEGARDALVRFRDAEAAPELKAEELRVAARHLGRLTGRIDVEDVLGEIFSEFCIGK